MFLVTENLTPQKRDMHVVKSCFKRRSAFRQIIINEPSIKRYKLPTQFEALHEKHFTLKRKSSKKTFNLSDYILKLIGFNFNPMY